MSSPCEIRNNRDHEIWMGVKFSKGPGVVANLLPSHTRVVCAPPGASVISMTVYSSQQKALEDIPDAFSVESRPK